MTYLADTTKLTGAELTSFNVSYDGLGNPRPEQHDQQDAAFELHKLLEIIVNRSEGKNLNLNASLDLSSPTTEEAQRMTPAQIAAVLWKPPAALPAPADPVTAPP